MARIPEKQIVRRRKHICSELLSNPNVDISKLTQTIVRDYDVSPNISAKEVEFCRQILGLISHVGIANLLGAKTFIGSRLRNEQSKQIRAKLAKAVADYIENKPGEIRELILGTGSTIYEVAQEIIARENDLSIDYIYTTSFLVLYAFALGKPSRIRLEVVNGIWDDHTASLQSSRAIDRLLSSHAQAVITSFAGLSTEGFITRTIHDKDEKLMNLYPGNGCEYVIIPMEWKKLARRSLEHLKKGKEALEFLSGKKKYVLVTDYPKRILTAHDRSASEIMDDWAKRGGEVIKVN